jgi:hypothetical protein
MRDAIQVGQAMREAMHRAEATSAHRLRAQRVSPRRVVPLWVRRVVAARMQREHAACGCLSRTTRAMLRVLALWARR